MRRSIAGATTLWDRRAVPLTPLAQNRLLSLSQHRGYPFDLAKEPLIIVHTARQHPRPAGEHVTVGESLLRAGNVRVAHDCLTSHPCPSALIVLPRYLSDADVERVIAPCDIASAIAQRDRAILLLLARLGLRVLATPYTCGSTRSTGKDMDPRVRKGTT